MRFHLETTDDARRARRALGTLAWVPLAVAALWVGTDLAQQRMWTALQDGSVDHDALGRWMRIISHVNAAVAVAAIATMVVVCGRLPLRARWLAATTSAAFGLLLLQHLAVQTAIVGGNFDAVQDLRWFGQLATMVAWTLLAITLVTASRRRPVDLRLGAVAVIVPVGLAALTLALEYEAISNAWFNAHRMAWWAIYAALVCAQMTALSWLARRAAATLPEPTAEDEWRAAGRGLHLFASAVVARVVIVSCFVLLLVLANVARSIGLLKLTLIAVPLASVAAGAVAAVGMASFAHLPYLEGARRAARAVFLLLIAGLILDGIGLHAALMTVLGAQDRFDLDLELLRQADLGAQLASLTAAIVLLVALRATAAHIARPELGGTATALIGPVLLIAGGGIALRHYAAHGEIERDLGAILMLLASIATIVVMLAFAKLAHRVSAAMGDSAVPSPARASYRESKSG